MKMGRVRSGEMIHKFSLSQVFFPRPSQLDMRRLGISEFTSGQIFSRYASNKFAAIPHFAMYSWVGPTTVPFAPLAMEERQEQRLYR